MQWLLFLTVSFGASVVGAICGIGGGVIIKPALDLFHLASVSTISFLSGCTVLSMSLYNVSRSLASPGSAIDTKTGTPLALGAAAGGILGQNLFAAVRACFADPNAVGSVQAVCLFAVTFGTLIYTLNRRRVHTHRVTHPAACALIGLALGVMSSFLGIGGGPINLVVLAYFFSMPTKTAAQNSLYIILFSQIANLFATILAGSVPAFEPSTLALMVLGGIGGGMLGRTFNKRMDARAVDRLFIGLMLVIMGISLFNAWRYAAL